jgi:Asp-tRNA(Asn)/Glu-tRNA(Gln) amidotransferase A subunit family amidase
VELTIIGAGAIGGTIGAHLIRDGHDVLLCDADQAHVDAINARGLSIEGARGLSIEGPVENFTVADYAAACARRDQLRPAAAAAYAGTDVLLTPVMPWPAPPDGVAAGPDGGQFEQPCNVTGAPALALPCGRTPDGLPVGLQLSAPPGADLALLAAAGRVEAILAAAGLTVPFREI